MLVHAHPDDESINNGATMARYVDEGAQVTLVTCTLGEEGEVLVPDLDHLAADHDDELGEHRLGELQEAMACLGVTDFVRLGGDGRFRDSGMAWDDGRHGHRPRHACARASSGPPTCWRPPNELVPLIRDRRPQVLITYNEIGGYGHPDHIQAHRVAMYGYQLAGDAALPARPGRGVAGRPGAVDDDERDPAARGSAGAAGGRRHRDLRRPRPRGPARPDGRARRGDRRRDRRRRRGSAASWTPCGRTPPRSPPTASSSPATAVLGDTMWSHEYYRLAAGTPYPDPTSWADDVFAGLKLAG